MTTATEDIDIDIDNSVNRAGDLVGGHVVEAHCSVRAASHSYQPDLIDLIDLYV